MDEKQIERAMQLISIAGNAKSLAIKAMNSAELRDFDQADTELREAKSTLHEAHNLQTKWMTDEINGEIVEKTLILIHSQDHFISADTIIILSEKIISIQKQLVNLKAKHE